MQSLIRKHRVIFAWAILLFIGVPMLFWSIPQLGGKSEQVDPNNPEIANVGGVPVLASRFQQNLDAMAKQRMQGDKRPTRAELDEQGVITDILEQMESSALIEAEIKERGFNVSKDFMVKQLQKESIFKNEEGNFDPEAWNTWVETQERGGTNWAKLYDDFREDLARQNFLDELRMASGHVADSELTTQLMDDHTKLKVKYLQVEPPVDEASGELRAYYDANTETFRKPDVKTASYVAFSLRAARPAKADDVVTRARAGEDFATLATENSDMQTENGGDMGWRREREGEQAYRKTMFALKAGEVSDPVEGPNGFYIYKVEEERLVDDAGNVIPAETAAIVEPKPIREIHVRQIFVEAKLTDEEKAAKTEEANKLSARATELTSLAEAAKEAGLEVKTAAGFSDKSEAIDGISATDLFDFRKAFTDASATTTVITAKDNIYVASLENTEQGEIPPFEEVVEDVTKAFKTGAPEYKARVQEYTDKIKAGAVNLENAKSIAPDMTSEIAELDFFTRKDMLFQQQFYVMPTQIFEELGTKPIGTMSAPLTDFRNNIYFLELADRQLPTDEDKAKWDEEKKTLRDQIAGRKGSQLIEDYALYLRQTKLPPKGNTMVTYNHELIDQIIERVAGPAEPAPAAPTADAATETSVVEIPAAAEAAPAAGTPVVTEAPAVVEAAPAVVTPPPAETAGPGNGQEVTNPPALDAAPAVPAPPAAEAPAQQ